MVIMIFVEGVLFVVKVIVIKVSIKKVVCVDRKVEDWVWGVLEGWGEFKFKFKDVKFVMGLF